MKVSEKLVKRLITKSILKEDSADAYARFVRNMEKLALFSDKSLSMQRYKKEKPEFYEKIKALGQRLIKKIQGDFPGTIDVDSLSDIIKKARQEKRADPSIDYGAKVIEYAKNYWFDNIGPARHADSEHGGHTLMAADPRARGAVAKSLDRTLKYAWKEEANLPENKEFWDNFEVWHAIGGIVGERGTINHQTVLGFLEAFKNPNPHEMSAYGWSGLRGATDGESINNGITGIINSESGWKDKVHVKLDGEITFAANFDITTQWFSYKEDDEADFEKAGDLNKMLTYGKFGSMITGPKDKLLSGMDKYNEIVIKDAKVVAIALPEAFFQELKDIGMYRVADMNLLYMGQLIKDGDIQTANEELLEASGETGGYTGGAWYGAAVEQIVDAMANGDKSLIGSDNRVINVMKYIAKYAEYDIDMYHVNGKSMKREVLNFVDAINTCINFIESNPELKTRKELTWYDWVSETRPPIQKAALDSLMKFTKDEEVKNFIMSEEGNEFFKKKLKDYRLGSYYFNPNRNPEYKEFIFNPDALLNQKVPYKYMRKGASAPVHLSQLIMMAIAMSKAAEEGIPPFVAPPPQEETRPTNLISTPYYVRLRWTQPNGEKKSYADVGGQQIKPHQNNAETIINWNNNIVRGGGTIDLFQIWGPNQSEWITVNSPEQLRSLLVPVLPKKIAESKITRRQIRSLIRKIL